MKHIIEIIHNYQCVQLNPTSYKIPFDEHGNQKEFNNHYFKGKLKNWDDIDEEFGIIDNFYFNDTLEYSHYVNGANSSKFIFRRSNGSTVIMFVSDFDKIVCKMYGGKLTGKFTFRKQGQVFGCYLVENED